MTVQPQARKPAASTAGRCPDHRPFALVLAGGGARGFAHVGVLRGLGVLRLTPSALVGVSMGAVVSATWSLREDWYAQLLAMDTTAFPRPLREPEDGYRSGRERVRSWIAFARAGWDMFAGWGVGAPAVPAGKAMLRHLTAGRRLEEGRVPVTVSTTDLRTGRRVALARGDAAEAVYASAALAGVLPPQPRDEGLLADGVYADIAPIDLARGYGLPVVIAVDPGQSLQSRAPGTGYEALLRAVEICQLSHAHLRFDAADLVLRPPFRRTIDTLEFDARRECVAAGLRAVRRSRRELVGLLEARPWTTP